MWEFYLASSEMAFRESDMVVFQLQMTKRKGVVPQTRDYIGREEARLRALEVESTLRRCVLPASRADRGNVGKARRSRSFALQPPIARWCNGESRNECFPLPGWSTIDGLARLGQGFAISTVALSLSDSQC